MSKRTIFPGDVVGNWTIVEVPPCVDGIRYLICRCNFCGTEKTLRCNNVAKTYSCGCCKRQYEVDPEAHKDVLGNTYPCDSCVTDNDKCGKFRTCKALSGVAQARMERNQGGGRAVKAQAQNSQKGAITWREATQGCFSFSIGESRLNPSPVTSARRYCSRC